LFLFEFFIFISVDLSFEWRVFVPSLPFTAKSVLSHLSAYLYYFNFQFMHGRVSLLIGLHLLLAWNSDVVLLILFSNQNLS